MRTQRRTPSSVWARTARVADCPAVGGTNVRTAVVIVQWLVRLIGATMLLLGISFWTGNAVSLIPVHMLLGLAFVLLLWTLAGLGLRAGVPIGLAIVAFAWGLVVPILGLNQDGLLPGPLHWLIQVLHLLVGLGAI